MSETAENALYLREAGPAPSFPSVTGGHRSEVAIVGGGLTGLSTALHLAEMGCDVTLLEAQQPGWGASGRNGGQLNPGLKYDPSWFLEKFGAAPGREIVAFGWSTVDETAALIRRLEIDCDLRQNGTLRAAATETDAKAVRHSFQDMAAHGMPVALLEADEVAQATGHSFYRCALLDRRGGDLNPLLFSRGLAKAAEAAGARIFADSRVSALQRDGGSWRLRVKGAEIEADRVLIACNAYADGLVPGLKRALVPVFSSVLGSHPLPERLAAGIMPGRQVLYEAGLVTIYCRVDQQGHLIIGGRGPMRPSSAVRDMPAVTRHALKLWPQLAEVGWKYAWNGRVAITKDHLPHLHSPADKLLVVYGYNGRGVALATAMGRRLAGALASGEGLGSLPLPISPLRPIALHRCWPLAVRATILHARLRNAFRP